MVRLKVGNSLSLNFLEARIDHGVCDEGPLEVPPYNVKEPGLLWGAATFPDNRQEFIWFSPAAE